MGGLKYGGLIEAWKVSLIEVRARTYGFIEADIPDLKQRIVPELIKVDFDPELQGGAEEKTFVISIIDRQLMMVQRSRKRDMRRASYEAEIYDEEEVLDQQLFLSIDESERTELRIDLERVMTGLSADERKICVGLMQGDSQADLARELGKSKATISNVVARLREKLREWGLRVF